ncbi:MAG: hypothetical protein M3081_02445, partial [Gemmatimonadota bacterium]|nr:hypothetical protein [Gemmatimonadota bacterium]
LGMAHAAGDKQQVSHPDLMNLLRRFETSALSAPLPSVSAFASVSPAALQQFVAALLELRKQAVERQTALPYGTTAGSSDPTGKKLGDNALTQARDATARRLLRSAAVANEGLAITSTLIPAPIGMLNLERLELAPAGIERGELIATIPLAPGEKTAVVQKEWSVTTKEFTSIVTDSLENVSETGVTDNTELAQSTTSQIQHANQFNITGTVSGGIPMISGSSTAAFGAQDATSQSATDSRKHASTVTQKASSRTKREHKVTISTTTVTGASETTTRELVNPSLTDPMRIDYFKMMRKWRVRLYRYGLRLTYDIVIPEPAGTLRKDYAHLEWLQKQIVPFDFPVTHAFIATASVAQILAIADQYDAQISPPPPDAHDIFVNLNPPNTDPDGVSIVQLPPLNVPDGYWIRQLFISYHYESHTGSHKAKFSVLWSTLPVDNNSQNDAGPIELTTPANGSLLLHGGGPAVVSCRLENTTNVAISLRAVIEPSDAALTQWRNDAWNALFSAAQAQYYATQQDIAAQIAKLEARLAAVDTLTLRREENDEVMKGALRFLLGVGFEFMDDTVDLAITQSGGDVDAPHGIAFTTNKVAINGLQLAGISAFEDEVRFINQAIEWENVVTFLYSYFWDLPEGWEFIRQITAPDPTRQAFLRAGSARVVLTVRKGFEQDWLRFVDGIPVGQETPRLTIAREIAAYDDRNYPGIPPANPGRSAVRLEDAVYSTSATEIPAPAPGVVLTDVVVTVESTTGFLVGAQVVVDSGVDMDPTPHNGKQEQSTISAIGTATLTLATIRNGHGGDGASYVVLQPGERGALIAEWNEYTPTSGTDIAVTSNLATIA